MTIQQNIATEFNLQSKYQDVFGSKVHYVEQGTGDPILFIHGIPTWSYLWRNIIPHLSEYGHCIAPDLIGFGLSDKPEIDYTVYDYINYLTEFISVLDLDNINLVLHGWGSVIGLQIARQIPDKIKSIALIESHLRPVTEWEMLSLPVQELAMIRKEPDGGYQTLVEDDYFLDLYFQSGFLRKLSNEELNNYLLPFHDEKSRLPIWQYVQDLPLGDGPQDVVNMVQQNTDYLCESNIPKLVLYCIPGFITTMDTVKWARDNIKNCKFDEINYALHYPQETNPDIMGAALKSWFNSEVKLCQVS